MNDVVVSTIAFDAGDRGSMDQQIFNFPFSPSHPKPFSLKLATSRITYPSDAQRGEL